MKRLVSIIIPTYKNRGCLSESIDSVLRQNFNNTFEIIVVDDNEPDTPERRETEALMTRYSQDDRIKYLKHPHNKNGSAARNTGFRSSEGKYIIFLDDDDRLLKDNLSKQIGYLEAHPEFSAVYCFCIRNQRIPSTKIIEGNGSRDILLLQSNFQTSTLMFRREAVERIGGFDESFIRHQDYEFMLRFFDANQTLGCNPTPLIEIGKNQGENILSGQKLNELKQYFFSKFEKFIANEEQKSPGFKNKILAKHYSTVFLNHIKHKHFILALRIFIKYYFKNPSVFTSVIIKSARLHITGQA